MKTHFRTPVLGLLLFSGCTFAMAQSVSTEDSDSDNADDSKVKVEFVKVHKDSTLQAIIEKDMPVGPKEVATPNFALRTSDNKFILTIGGYVNPIIGADFGNNLYKVDGAGISFVTSKIPVPSVAGHRSDTYINPFQGALSFEAVGFGGTENQITGYFKIGTSGMSPSLNFLRAYLSWRGFTAGQKLTLMQDVYACQPPTIDPEGPSGCISNVAYELSYKSKSYNGFRFAAGLDYPSYYSSNGVYRGKDYPIFDGKMLSNPDAYEQVVPDIPMWVEYQQSPSMRVRLSGLIRNFFYKDLRNNEKMHDLGWAVMLSGNVQPVKPWTLYLQAVYGQGIGAYLQDVAGLPLSYIPDDAHPGKMKATPMMGLNIGSSLNIGKRWQWNIMASEARVWGVKDYAMTNPDNDYKYGFYFATNVFYNITSYLQWGVEYLYGIHGTWAGTTGHDNRIQTQLMFSF